MRTPAIGKILTSMLPPLLLLWPAFVNGYPYVYSDTSTYLSAGFELETPMDRPMTYGLFMWLTSLGGVTLWGTVYAQAWIVNHVLRGCLNAFSSGASDGLQWMVVGALAAFSSLGWITSQLMPDIFSSIMVLSLAPFIRGRAVGTDAALCCVIFFLSCCMHASHFSIVVVLLTILCLAQWGSVMQFRPYVIAGALAGCSLLTMGSALGKSKSVFFMGAMAEHGILGAYLQEHCPGDLRLCAFKDSIPPKAYQFIWDKSGPVQRMGGFSSVNEEFTAVIGATLTDPRYLLLHIKGSFKATMEQLTLFGLGDGWGAFAEGTELNRRVERYAPLDHMGYVNARQQRASTAYVATFSRLSAWFVLVSLVIITVGFWSGGKRDLVWVTFVLLLAVIINAWSCGTFANAIDRLGAKMSWLPCLVALLWCCERTFWPFDRSTTNDNVDGSLRSGRYL